MIAVRGPCFGAGLGLSPSASAQGIIKGSAASMKKPLPDLSAGPTKTSLAKATRDLPESQLIDEKLCSDLIIRTIESALFDCQRGRANRNAKFFAKPVSQLQ